MVSRKNRIQYFSLTYCFRNFFSPSTKKRYFALINLETVLRDSTSKDASISSLPAVASSVRYERRGAIRGCFINLVPIRLHFEKRIPYWFTWLKYLADIFMGIFITMSEIKTFYEMSKKFCLKRGLKKIMLAYLKGTMLLR